MLQKEILIDQDYLNEFEDIKNHDYNNVLEYISI